MDKVIDSEDFESSAFWFDDEVDCAILNDTEFNNAMEDIANDRATAVEETIDDELGDDDIIDTSIEYDDTPPGADEISIDADDVIAAARDIERDPFEDDDLVDAALGEDYDIDDDEDFIDSEEDENDDDDFEED